MWLEIGKIVGVQGLNGEVRVYPNSDFPERFEQPGTRWLLRPEATEPEPIELASGRYMANKGLYIVKIAGIDERTQAEQLRNCWLLVPERDRPPLDDDEFHVLDLIGLAVFDQATQTLIGSVVDVFSAGNDLLEVQLDPDRPSSPLSQNSEAPALKPVAQKRSTVLIPFVKAIVPIVDLEHRRIEITPPIGLIDP